MLLIFNDIAGSEILLILVFILIFFGSKSIPGLAKTMGRTIRQIKEASSDIQSEIKKSANEMKGDLDLKGIINETAEDVRRPLDQYAQDIDDAVKYTPPNKQSQVKPAESIENAEEVPESKTLDQQDVPKVEVEPKAEPKSEDKKQSPTD